MSQLIHIEAIEKRLWDTADTLRECEEMGIVREITGRQRNRLYLYDAYMAIYFVPGSVN